MREVHYQDVTRASHSDVYQYNPRPDGDLNHLHQSERVGFKTLRRWLTGNLIGLEGKGKTIERLEKKNRIVGLLGPFFSLSPSCGLSELHFGRHLLSRILLWVEGM